MTFSLLLLPACIRRTFSLSAFAFTFVALRLHFCDAATQQRFFPVQLDLARALQLPLFLHSRAAADDFLDIMRSNIDTLPCGCVGR